MPDILSCTTEKARTCTTTEENDTQHNTTQHNTTQHNTTQHSIIIIIISYSNDNGIYNNETYNDDSKTNDYPRDECGVCLPSQSASEKHNQEKSPCTFAHLVNFKTKCVCHVWSSYTLVISNINLSHTLNAWSAFRDLGVLRAQRLIGFFYLNYPQINEVGKTDHMATTVCNNHNNHSYLGMRWANHDFHNKVIYIGKVVEHAYKGRSCRWQRSSEDKTMDS